MNLPLRVAAFQRRPMFDDDGASTAALARDLAWSDSHGVDLALFPECFLLGHSYDVGTISRRAMALGSVRLRNMIAPLSHTRTTAVVGLFEQRGTAIYNTAVVIRGGRVIGSYSKAFPNESGVDAGTEFPTFALSNTHFGINICNDANYAEASAGLASRGATLIAFPLNNMLRPEIAENWRNRSVDNLQARARATGCWIASSDVTGIHCGLTSFGCTMIIDPAGNIVARVPENEEGAVIVGKNSHPEIYRGG